MGIDKGALELESWKEAKCFIILQRKWRPWWNGGRAASTRETDLRPIPPQPKNLFPGSMEYRRHLFHVEGDVEVQEKKHLTESQQEVHREARLTCLGFRF